MTAPPGRPWHRIGRGDRSRRRRAGRDPGVTLLATTGHLLDLREVRDGGPAAEVLVDDLLWRIGLDDWQRRRPRWWQRRRRVAWLVEALVWAEEQHRLQARSTYFGSSH